VAATAAVMETPRLLFCTVCHENSIQAPDGATAMTTFTCRECSMAEMIERHIAEARVGIRKLGEGRFQKGTVPPRARGLRSEVVRGFTGVIPVFSRA